MKTRSFRADKLDVPAFAVAGATLRGELTLSRLERLRTSLHPEAPRGALDAAVPWQATGEARQHSSGTPELWLHLAACTVVPMTCQRCLRQIDEDLRLNRWYRFVDNESLAAELDADSDDDVLVASRSFQLLNLIEDELLLALPLAPWHGVCPEPLPVPLDSAAPSFEPPIELEPETRRQPFAALAALKKTPRAAN